MDKYSVYSQLINYVFTLKISIRLPYVSDMEMPLLALKNSSLGFTSKGACVPACNLCDMEVGPGQVEMIGVGGTRGLMGSRISHQEFLSPVVLVCKDLSAQGSE